MIGWSALIFDLLSSNYAHEKTCTSFCTHFVSSCGLIILYHKSFYKDCFKMFPIMLALCLMLSETYYAQNYAGIANRPGAFWFNKFILLCSVSMFASDPFITKGR